MRIRMILFTLSLALAAGFSHGQGASPESKTNPWFKPRPLAPPNVPALTAFMTPSGGHGLKWTHLPGVDGYRVYRSADGKTFAQIGELKDDGTTFTDRDPAARGVVYYRVQAYNAAGVSDSNTALLRGERKATAVRMSPMRVPPEPSVRNGGARRGRIRR